MILCNMTKLQLANKKSSEVRNNTTLFSLFKSFIIEDFGAIPSGCFGCEFNKHFERWAKQYRQQAVVLNKIKINTNKMSYRLKDEGYKTYHKGEVLSVNSSDEQWADFILSNEVQSEQRKSLFLVLPSAISTEDEKAVEAVVVADIEEKKSENLTQAAVVKKVKNARKK
jgi:hypothetical protein